MDKAAKNLEIGDNVVESDHGQGIVKLVVPMQVLGDPEPSMYAIILEGFGGKRLHGIFSPNEQVKID